MDIHQPTTHNNNALNKGQEPYQRVVFGSFLWENEPQLRQDEVAMLEHIIGPGVFGFEVERWLLAPESPDNDALLEEHLEKIKAKVESCPRSLFIFYYSGHGGAGVDGALALGPIR